MFKEENEITLKKALTAIRTKKCPSMLCRHCPGRLAKIFCNGSEEAEKTLINISKDYVNWYFSRKWLKRLKKKK